MRFDALPAALAVATALAVPLTPAGAVARLPMCGQGTGPAIPGRTPDAPMSPLCHAVCASRRMVEDEHG